jgi:hypothetical protein
MLKFKQTMACCAAVFMMTSSFAMTSAEQKVEKERITADYKAAHNQCKALKSNAKDVCEKEAKGHEKVALAELEYKKNPSDSNRYHVGKTRADAEYEVMQEKCDDQTGNAKDVCKKDAKAAHVKAVETAKVAEVRNDPGAKPSELSEARKDASDHVRKADYKAAAERCDALSGDAKDKCIMDAKRQYAQ